MSEAARDPRTEPSVNERIAREVMGWEVVFAPGNLPEGPFYLVNGSGFDFPEGPAHPVPDFEHLLDACALAEKRIEELGLITEYIDQLEHLRYAGIEAESAPLTLRYFLVRLTPAQRCQALLKAVTK